VGGLWNPRAQILDIVNGARDMRSSSRFVLVELCLRLLEYAGARARGAAQAPGQYRRRLRYEKAIDAEFYRTLATLQAVQRARRSRSASAAQNGAEDA